MATLSDPAEKPLGAQFDECETIVNLLEFGFETITPENVEKCANELRSLKTLVEQADVLSANDSLEDVPTNRRVPIDERLDLLHESQKFYGDFLLTADLFGFNPFPSATRTAAAAAEEENAPRSSLTADVQERQRRMEISGAADELRDEIRRLHAEFQRTADEAVQREMELKKLKLWCILAQRAIERIGREAQMLEFRRSQPGGPPAGAQPRQPLKTFVIPKSDEQKKVFGLGYPAAPTQTVNECRPLRRLPDDSGDEDERDVDSEEARKKQADKDDYLDSHRRGWGNRHGKG
ncbi:hypothetical protein M3Y99_01646600 [Aphelenchoides fujianensis]|nr:hypothetical protein M3Y99_01646600 [Aphelenchoides fujianensis]